jgi:hypothetical protein
MAPAGPRLATLLAGVALAAIAAGAAAWFRAPVMRETAVTVDSQLHLQNRLVTAFQYRDATDEFSRLVVRDALSHAGGVRPASAFPVRIPGWVRVAAIAVFAAPLVFFLARTSVPEFWQRASIGDASAPGALSVPSPGGSRGGTPANPDGTASTIADGAAREQVEGAIPSQSSRDAHVQSERAADSADSPASPAPGNTRENGEPRAAGQPDSASGRGIQPQTGVTAGVGAGRGAGAAGSRQTAQAGGLTGDPASDDIAQSQAASQPARDRAYSTAWSASQRAIAQEHVPSALREYVRQYFLAIRPAENR